MLAFAVPAGAALVTLAALPGAASAAAHASSATHANSMATSARVATVIPATTKAVTAADIATVTTSGKTLSATAAKTGFSVYPTSGSQQGAVRGPGGQIWLIGFTPTQFQGAPAGSQALDEVSPITGAVNYWAPLPPYLGTRASQTLLAYDNGAPAFSGANAWMIATATTPGGAVSHYLVRYTPGPSTSHTYKLPATCGSPQDITSAGNGSMWLACGSSRVIRVTSTGAMRMFSLSHVSSVTHFAAGPVGSMWAVGYNGRRAAIGLVRITAGGGESYFATPRGITPRNLAGNGSSRVIETANCGSRVCLESVSTSGRLSHAGTVPGTVRAIWGPSMDASGNVWLMVHGSASRTGEYFLRLTSRNRIQVYPFSLPGGCNGSLLAGAGIPAGSADGSAWIESVSNCTFIGNTATAYVGGLIRFKP